MEKLSKKKISQKLHFWDLIDYKVSFDFLLGNFLNIFKRKMWLDNVSCLNENLLKDTRVWSNFDNTCAHIKIYANAFKKSPKLFYGKIREAFLEWVKKPELAKYILTTEKADFKHGGDGAFYVYLRKNKN